MLGSLSLIPRHLNWWPEVDELLGTEGACTCFTPALNVWEDAENFHLEAELPGTKLEDIEVSVLGNELTIRGGRKLEERAGATHHRQEWGYGKFERTVSLPAEVNPDHVQATLKDGILTITLPKEEVAKPRRIEVKVK